MVEVPPTRPRSADQLAALLEDARRRTRELTQDLPPERLFGPKISIINPVLWEIGHVGFFHDYFALRLLHGLDDYQHPDAEGLYDSSSIPHGDRWQLPLPSLDETWAYLERVKQAMIEHLPAGTASEAVSYVYQLTAFHEDMHGEAFLWTRQTLADPPPTLTTPPLPPAAPAGPLAGDVAIPGGEHILGSDAQVAFRFDNEKPPHSVTVEPFRIARAPVTNAEFAAFVDDGGYDERAHWSEAGWQWLQALARRAPRYWDRDPGGWTTRWFDQRVALAPHAPVSFVNYYEAEAWCHWAGRRLPTEAEWEVAASRMPTADGSGLAPGKRLYPWGDEPPTPERANLDGYRLGGVDVAAFPAGDSASAAARCSVMSGSGPRPLSRPIPVSGPISIAIIPNPGSRKAARFCAAAPGPPAPVWYTTVTATSFCPNATTCLPGFAPVPAKQKTCTNGGAKPRRKHAIRLL